MALNVKMPAAHKITDEDVRILRTTYNGYDYKAAAKHFGISNSYALSILYYRSRIAAGPPVDQVHYYISDGLGGRPKSTPKV